MSTNFQQAANRHFADADKLYGDASWANADQLYGLAAECAVKSIMHGLGMAVSRSGSPSDGGHRVHMPQIWAAFQSFARGRLASRYLDGLDHENPFADWSVDQRYGKDGLIKKANAERHQRAAAQCQQSLGRMILDGMAR